MLARLELELGGIFFVRCDCMVLIQFRQHYLSNDFGEFQKFWQRTSMVVVLDV